jgi:hypothetical protein
MRRIASFWILAALLVSLPGHAEEPREVSQQLARLNRILVLLVRADVISQKLTLDQMDLRELLGNREKLDVEIREAVGATFSESDLVELEELSPERARRERAAGVSREAKVTELRSRREVLENDIRLIRARIDSSIRRLEAIDKLLSVLSPDGETSALDSRP